jgi:glycosyltransferase involved in cell wall biosynthesis
VFSRLDYWNSGASAGGSITHNAAVIDAFNNLGVFVHQLSGLGMPTQQPERSPLEPVPTPDPAGVASQHFELGYFDAGIAMRGFFRKRIEEIAPAFLYERINGIGNCVVPITARTMNVPYIVEYNGSELWIAKHWTKTELRYFDAFMRMETASLRAADLVVVVSDPLREEVIERGVDPARVIVNFNAVDPDVYCPDRVANIGRQRRVELGIPGGEPVIGFVGTFGPWHGIPALMRAMPEMLAGPKKPHLLLIGDGSLRNEVESAAAALPDHLRGRLHRTGMVPLADAPGYLAACDVFVSPHQVPGDDHRPFFGSPTKVFEYMAMGRPMVASALGQIKDIVAPALASREVGTADAASTPALGVLTTPGASDQLAEAVAGLLERPELAARIAANARAAVFERHTWRRHVERIIEAAQGVTGIELLQDARPEVVTESAAMPNAAMSGSPDH